MAANGEENTTVALEDNPKIKEEEDTSFLKSPLAQLHDQVFTMTDMKTDKEQILNKLSDDKIKLLADLKKEQSRKKHLKEQLDLERRAHLKEKEQYCMEMYKHKRRKQGRILKHGQKRIKKEKKINEEISFLEKDNEELKKLLSERESTTHGLCVRYMRMKMIKDKLEMKLSLLEKEYTTKVTDMLAQLTDCKAQLCILADKGKPPHKTNALLLKIVEHNSRIGLENAVLKVEIQRLKNVISERTLHKLYRSRKKGADGELGRYQDKLLQRTSKATCTSEDISSMSPSCREMEPCSYQLKPTRSQSMPEILESVVSLHSDTSIVIPNE